MNPHFPAHLYASRITRAQSLMRANSLDAVIVAPGAQLAYLCSSWMSTHERFCALVIPAHGEPQFYYPAVDRAEIETSVIQDLPVRLVPWEDGHNPHQMVVDYFGRQPIRLGISDDLKASHLLRLQQLSAPQSEWVSATVILKELFIAKDEAEIAQVRSAGQAIDRVHAKIPELLRPGRTEREVATDINALILEEHSAVDFIIVGSMANGANPHHNYSDRKLCAGDVVVVDIGGTFGVGYHSDCTRTYIVGGNLDHLDPLMHELYEVLYLAQDAAVAAVKPGAKAQEIDAVARTAISSRGFGEYFIHRTGHGIGLSTHEEPYIMAGNDLILEPGMTFSVEPGIYIPGRFGARIEDIVLVTDKGCERLNNQPRTLR
ncbi:Xaa-Pro peptidase family protein [Corynebacterium sp. ES2794-CONJ1]|uniref:M24 family metallopeptidase n=1 Tax=Corynebacterium sp. ES2794-CONJ1 TaxID=2980553 RepID=UPI0021DA6343|nr:Xaa-Pro peptidase family protein [Corynebacterium sp. ES2794-CONJ1]MCU9518324.1 Xaa-Pro peptidase family protein [Corynebacterium sp. ES2794-CONJ1]